MFGGGGGEVHICSCTLLRTSKVLLNPPLSVNYAVSLKTKSRSNMSPYY